MNLHDKLDQAADMRREERWISDYLRREAARRDAWWRKIIRWLRA
jgi:hypothetical protein